MPDPLFRHIYVAYVAIRGHKHNRNLVVTILPSALARLEYLVQTGS